MQVYLLENKAIDNLLLVLEAWAFVLNSIEQRKVGEILDNVFLGLKNLICFDIKTPKNPNVYGACQTYAFKASQQIIRNTKVDAAKLFLNILLSSRISLRNRIFVV